MMEFPTRAVARSTRGMVASPHALATAAGVDVLRRGGNAVDAAIATNAVLAVVYPASCGLGGDALWLVHEPATKQTIAYNGSGAAAAGLTSALMRERGARAMPVRDAVCVTVPGAVRSWEDVLLAHGTRPLDELLLPAETYASEGFALTDVVANYAVLNAEMLARNGEAFAPFAGERAPSAGTVVRNLPLARSIAAIRSGGADAFYRGPIAQAICATLNALGNPMTPFDLAAHRTEVTAPLSLAWHGAQVLAHPPNSQASAALIALGMLDGDGAADDTAWTHLAVEALKHAFDIRDREYADPRAMSLDVASLLTPHALAAARAAIDPERARARTAQSDRGGTVAIVAADDSGRAVSLIQSLYMNFGTGIVARGTGIYLHNRGTYFSLEPGVPNELAGGKRPLHTLSPAMLMRDGRPELVYGTMGGDGQPQTHVQLLHRIYERGYDVQRAIDAPRFVYGRDSDSAFADSIRCESRVPRAVIDGLRARGHHVEVMGPFENALGHAHAIAIDHARGTFAGASDPRADSLALGP